jgi:hypothetical protein
MIAGVVSRATPRLDVPKSIAIRRSIDGQVARSVSIIARIITTEVAAETEPVTPKVSDSEPSASEASAVETSESEAFTVTTSSAMTASSAMSLGGSTADRWGDGERGDGSRDQQYARHAIILS